MEIGNDFQFLQMDFQEFWKKICNLCKWISKILEMHLQDFGNGFLIFGNGFSIFENAFSLL
jgi:hypothetical protein